MTTAQEESSEAGAPLSLEEQAWGLAADPERLRQRLEEARDALNPGKRAAFGTGQFNLRHRQLVSEDRFWALRWHVRRRPDEPISALNPQTATGYVAQGAPR